MVGSMDEVPRRGQLIPVIRDNGVEHYEVKTIDMAGYPVIGDDRHDDFETEQRNRVIIAQRLARQAEVTLTLEEELALLDQGGIGGLRSEYARVS